MDEMEKQAPPTEPEVLEEPAAEETVPVAEEAPAVTEETALAEEPVPQPVPAEQPRRRSPYENSPYMMPHQQPRQTPPVPPVQTPSEQPQKPAAENAEVKTAKAKKGKIWLLTFALIGAVLFMNFLTARWGADIAENRAASEITLLQEQIADLQEQLSEQQNSGDSVSGTPNVTVDGMTPGQVYARNEKSVVLIETDVATGSGFVLTEDGYVVTNYHVVEDGQEIAVVMSDRSYHEAALVGHDVNNDIALLKMEGSGYPAVTLGSSDALIVGDQVAAIGNPLGELTSTLTVGYVSAKERDVSTDSAVINMIQTDCAINSGNSGGPLFNMKGEVVGITTAKYSGMSASGASIEGIGFAVPMDDVRDILEDLMEFGYVKSAYLGVSVYTLGPSADQPLGCLVDSVVTGGCADKAGMRAGDIIIGLAGHEIEGYTDLSRVLRMFEGGETTTITVYRSGQQVILDITLDAKPREEAVQPETKPMPENGSYEEWYDYFFGE